MISVVAMTRCRSFMSRSLSDWCGRSDLAAPREHTNCAPVARLARRTPGQTDECIPGGLGVQALVEQASVVEPDQTGQVSPGIPDRANELEALSGLREQPV